MGPHTIKCLTETHKVRAMTMIDPATGWFEIVQVPCKQADEIINSLAFTWLTRCPWPTEVAMDRGKEFATEVRDTLIQECGVIRN